MKKIIIINILFLLAGNVYAQTAKIGGYFIGTDYISATAGAEYAFTNVSSNQLSITATYFILKNSAGKILFERKSDSNFDNYFFVFSLPDTYTAILKVNWGKTTKSDTVKIAINKRDISCPDSLLPKGVVSYRINGNDCRPAEVYFRPMFYGKEALPDSFAVYSGDGNRCIMRREHYLEIRNVYFLEGTYLPTYIFYKTVEVNGKKEMCYVQINESDSLYVIELQPDFEIIEPLHSSQSPVTFKNKSVWTPSHLPYDSVSWDFGNGDISHDYNASILYNTTAAYQVQLTMKVSGCVKQKSNITTVGISEITTGNCPIIFYPNPTGAQLQVEFGDVNNNVSADEYSIFNTAGQLVMHGNLSSRDAINRAPITINVESLTSGMYYLKILSKTLKFIKE